MKRVSYVTLFLVGSTFNELHFIAVHFTVSPNGRGISRTLNAILFLYYFWLFVSETREREKDVVGTNNEK